MSEVVAGQGGRDVWIELRISTTKGSRVAITVGMSDKAVDSVVDETAGRVKETFAALCEEYRRLDDVYPLNDTNE